MTEQTHPEYPIRHGVPAMDRCKCGGVRYWHAAAPSAGYWAASAKYSNWLVVRIESGY